MSILSRFRHPILSALELCLLHFLTLPARAEDLGGGAVLKQVKEAYQSLSGQVALEAVVQRVVSFGEQSKKSRRYYQMLEWEGGRMVHAIAQVAPNAPLIPGTFRIRWFDGKLLLASNPSKQYWVSVVEDPGAIFFRVKMEELRVRLYARFEHLDLESLRDISNAKRVTTKVGQRKLEALQVKWKDKLGQYTAWIEPDTYLVYRLQATFRDGRNMVQEEVEWTKLYRNTDPAEIKASTLAEYKRGEFFEDRLPY